MAKKSSRYLSVLILLGIFYIGTAVAQTNVYWATWVTNTTTNSAIINWHGNVSENGSVEYATSSYYDQHHSFDKTIEYPEVAQSPYRHLQLTGLEPNTSYIYCVEPFYNKTAFGNRMFRTMPVSGPFTFIVVGDSREGAHYAETKRFKYVADAITNEPDALFIFHVGDFAMIDYKTNWNIFFQCADKMLAKSAIFPVIGNHEYHNHTGELNPPTAAVNYNSAFDMPLNYSFDVADIRFIILNTPDPNNSNGDDPQPSLPLAESQVPWLERQLDNDMTGTFTLHHHPIWECERNKSTQALDPWETLYHPYNISANFAAHVHNYQRLNVKDIPYFVIGNGGGPCEELNVTNTNLYRVGLEMQLGYLKVTVDPANNTATAWEITVGKLTEDDDDETPQLYNPPVINDTITFPLKAKEDHTSDANRNANQEQIMMGNKNARAYGSGSATNKISIVNSQGPGEP